MLNAPRRWMAWIVSVGLIGTAVPTDTSAATSIALEVNGQVVRSDVTPSLKNGRVMVPLRWVAEALQADVQWDRDKRAVLIDTSAKQVSEGRGRDIGLWVEGRKLTPDVPPVVQRGRTLVSVRVIAEALGAEVQWIANERKVVVTRPEAKLGPITNVQWIEPAANWGFSRAPEYATRLDLERKQGEALDRLSAAIAEAEPAPPWTADGESLVLDFTVEHWDDPKGVRRENGTFRLSVSGSNMKLEALWVPEPVEMDLRSADGGVRRALESMQALLPAPFPTKAAKRTPVADATLSTERPLELSPVATGLPDGWHGRLAIDPVGGGYAVAVTTQPAISEYESKVWTSEDGADWRSMELPDSLSPGAIGFSADGARFLSDNRSGNVYRSKGASQEWALVWEYPIPESNFKYPPVRFLPEASNPSRVYAQIDHDTRMPMSNGLFRSEDGGQTWFWGGVNGDARMKFDFPEQVWADPATPGRVFANTDVAIMLSEETYNHAYVRPDVLVSEDGGSHWSALEGIGRFHGAGADESGPALLAVRTEGDATYLLTAGADASRWTERKLPFHTDNVAFDPTEPRTIAATGQRVGAPASQAAETFLSFDGGATWTSAGPAVGSIGHVDAKSKRLFLRNYYRRLEVYQY